MSDDVMAEFPFHVGIATPDVGALLASLGPTPGATWVDLPRPAVPHATPDGPVTPSSRVVWSSAGPFHTEVLQAEPGTVYDPRRGTHVHHLGYWADDVAAAVAAREADGWSLEVTMFDDDRRPSSFAYMSPPGMSPPGMSPHGPSSVGEPWIELIDRANREWLEALLRGDV
ncbi:MAG: VOC family protein [Acidimicrobiia bacterium]